MDQRAKAMHEVTQPSPLPPTRQANVVIRNFDPKKNRPVAKPREQWLVSPLTGERIPSNRLEEHVKFNTMDTQYKEERDRKQAEQASVVGGYVSGSDMGRSLASFAERRSDIFGVGASGARQAEIGQKLADSTASGHEAHASGLVSQTPSSSQRPKRGCPPAVEASKKPRLSSDKR